MIAHGLQANLLGVRAVIEDFNFISTGIVMSGYFIGFFVGSIIDSVTGNIIYGGRTRTGIIKQKFEIVRLKKDDSSKIETFNTNFVVIRSSILKSIGGLRSFKHAFADYDLGFRLIKAGIDIQLYQLPVAECSNTIEENNSKKLLSKKKAFY